MSTGEGRDWEGMNEMVFKAVERRQTHVLALGLPSWLSGKEPTCQFKNEGSVLGLGRSPGEGNGNPLQYSCLESPMERGAW